MTNEMNLQDARVSAPLTPIFENKETSTRKKESNVPWCVEIPVRSICR